MTDHTSKRVNGLYLGLFPYTGTVISTEVGIGGNATYTIALDESIRVYQEDRATIIVCSAEINRVLDDRDASL